MVAPARTESCAVASAFTPPSTSIRVQILTRFKANVHKQTLLMNGKVTRVKICTRCLRTMHKPPRARKASAAG